MNITPQAPNLSTPTVLNPHTESLRRENNQREIITPPAAASQSAAEKGVASDRERSRTPAQNNANIDFASISEQAELANTSIAGQDEKQNGQSGQENNDDARESNSSSYEYEELMNKTLKNQDKILPSQPEVIVQRALRIESFYASITQAYEKPPTFKFELTV